MRRMDECGSSTSVAANTMVCAAEAWVTSAGIQPRRDTIPFFGFGVWGLGFVNDYTHEGMDLGTA